MTITSTTSREVNNGNDTAVEFPFAFKINKTGDLVVTFIASDLTKTVLVEGTGVDNYSVAGTFPGTGAVTYPASGAGKLATGEKLVNERIVPLTQETDLVNQGAWNPDQVEDMHDYSMMVAQQNEDKSERSLKVSIADDTGANYELPPAKGGTVVAVWDEEGKNLVPGPTASEIVNAQSNAEVAVAGAVTAAEQAESAGESAIAAAAAAASASGKISNTGSKGALVVYDETDGLAAEVAPGVLDTWYGGNGTEQPGEMKAFPVNTPREYSKTQNFNATALTDAASIVWDLEINQVASVTLEGNRTLAAPTNMVDGATYILTVIQDATGSRTLAYNAAFKFPEGEIPVLTTTANAVDILTFVCNGTVMRGAIAQDFK